MSPLTSQFLRRLEQFQLLPTRRVESRATPALTPRRGRILRRVVSQHQPSVLRQFSPANHQSAATGNSPSAKRMNMNSRGCQPTEQRLRTNPTLKGSHNEPSKRTFHIRPTHRQSPPHCSALSGPILFRCRFRGFHPRLFMLFAAGEVPDSKRARIRSHSTNRAPKRGCITLN